MNDNVQPITPQAVPDLPEMGEAQNPLPTQESSSNNPMPLWFKMIILVVLLIVGGGMYLGYLVATKQIDLPGADKTSAIVPIAPAAPAEPQPLNAGGFHSSASPQSESPYQINIAIPDTQVAESTMPGTQPVTVGSSETRMTVNVEAQPVIPTLVEEAPIELPPVTKATTAEVLAEHSERLLALENMTADHAEILALMKDELKATREQVASSDKTIRDAVKKFERVAKQVTTSSNSAELSKTASKSRAARSLPFKPVSYRTFGDQVSVRVRAPRQSATSLRVGQALDGWRLLSADPVNRTAVFININTFKKEEVML